MDSVDKLREIAFQYDGLGVLRGNLNAIADEIERDYMRLPLDKDGVPIHVGDMVRDDDGVSKVMAVTESRYVDELGYMNAAAGCTHRNAPTVEDVLREFADLVRDDGGYDEARISVWAEALREVLRDE